MQSKCGVGECNRVTAAAKRSAVMVHGWAFLFCNKKTDEGEEKRGGGRKRE